MLQSLQQDPALAQLQREVAARRRLSLRKSLAPAGVAAVGSACLALLGLAGLLAGPSSWAAPSVLAGCGGLVVSLYLLSRAWLLGDLAVSPSFARDPEELCRGFHMWALTRFDRDPHVFAGVCHWFPLPVLQEYGPSAQPTRDLMRRWREVRQLLGGPSRRLRTPDIRVQSRRRKESDAVDLVARVHGLTGRVVVCINTAICCNGHWFLATPEPVEAD